MLGHYSGELGRCSQFLFQCSLILSQQLSTYPTDAAKIAFVTSPLLGREAACALDAFSAKQELQSDFETFTHKKVFDHPVNWREATGRLLFFLRQGGQPVSEFAITFHILAAEADWDQKALPRS